MPVEITWSPEGIEVVWATEAEWVDTTRSRHDYEARP